MMTSLADNLAYTPLQGSVEYQEYNPYNPEAVDETWKYIAPLGIGLRRLGLKGLEYLPYLKDIWQGRDLLFHTPFDQMTSEEFKNYGKIGENYYKNFLQKNPVEIDNYGLVTFSKHNRGKDTTINMEQYPFLRKNLRNAIKEDFSTNYKNEIDRNYDYFSNTHKGDLYHYLIENIDNKGLKYKMMKNKTLGE